MKKNIKPGLIMVLIRILLKRNPLGGTNRVREDEKEISKMKFSKITIQDIISSD